MMSHRRSSPVIALTLLLALVAAPKSPAASFRHDLVLAQAPASPAFRLPESVANDTIVKIDGSTSLETINQLLKQRFQQRYNGTQVEDSYSGTDSALQSVLDGKVDLAAIGRLLTDAEKAEGLSAVPIAHHKIAILVSPDNPYKGNISYQQFAKIFRGEITDWAELGGNPGPIRFIDRPDTSDTRLAFNNYPVFKESPFETGANAVKAEDTTDAVVEQLGTDGISFAIVDQVLDRQDVRIVPMHKTLPTDPRYPFSQPLTYVYKRNPSPAVLAFLGFATDASNKQAIAQAGVSEAIAAEPSPATASPATELSPSPSSAAAVSPAGEAPSASPGALVAVADSEKDWLPWLLLPLLGGIGALLWALRGRQRPDLRVADERVAPPRVPPVDMAPPRLAPPVSTGAPGAVGAIAATGAVGAIAATGAAMTGAAIANRRHSRIILTPHNSEQAYAYWEAPEAHKAELRHQGGEALKLRIYEVTDIDLDTQSPHSVLQYDCAETDQDRHVPIPESDRDYLAEIGYTTPDHRWLMLARSAPVRVVTEIKPTNGLGLGAIAGGAAIAAVSALTAEPLAPANEPAISPAELIPPSRIVLTPRNFEDAYAYWETPEAAKADLRRQGGKRLTLLLADVTDLDLDTQVPYNVQQFSCAETETDRHLPIPVGDRDYIAEIGYLTDDSQWLLLARSEPVRVPPVPPVDSAEVIDALLVEAEPVAGESAIMAAVEENLAPAEQAELPGMEIGAAALGTGAALGVGYVLHRSYTEHPPSEAARPDLSHSERNGEDLASVDEGLPDLPTDYGESRITLMARDPHWAYAYWDIPAARREALQQIGGTSLALRFYDVTDVSLDTQNPHSLQQYYCDEAARDWYIPVPVSDRDYIIEIGYVTTEGIWLMLARSIPVRMPPVYPSDWQEEKFTTVPWEEEIRTRVFQELVEPYRWSGSENPVYDRIFRLAEISQEQRISGSLFGSMQQVPQVIVSSFVLPTPSGIPGVVTESGVGMMSGVGISGAGISGAGISGMGMSGIGMSGIGIGAVPALLSMSGIGMSGIGFLNLSNLSGVGMAGMSGIGLYTLSGIGLAGMSGIGLYTMSGIGMPRMPGTGSYSMSGVGNMSGTGFANASGIGSLSGTGFMTASGIGMYSLSGVSMYSLSGVGMYSLSGIGMSGIGLSNSAPSQPRNFWLVADAELIVHGATEPDATVTIAGQIVRLSPDGTFRFQVVFPDGNFDYPILAVAADGEQTRAIHMKFSRDTPVRRTNTKDEALNEWTS